MAYEAVWRERAELHDHVHELEQELSRHREGEQAMRNALITAERAADEMRASASRQAELIVREAEAKSRDLVHDAYAERERVRREMAGLQAEEAEFRLRLRSLLGAILEAVRDHEERLPAPPTSRRGRRHSRHARPRPAGRRRQRRRLTDPGLRPRVAILICGGEPWRDRRHRSRQASPDGASAPRSSRSAAGSAEEASPSVVDAAAADDGPKRTSADSAAETLDRGIELSLEDNAEHLLAAIDVGARAHRGRGVRHVRPLRHADRARATGGPAVGDEVHRVQAPGGAGLIHVEAEPQPAHRAGSLQWAGLLRPSRSLRSSPIR